MKYKFVCPLDGCGEDMNVEANTDEEAVDRLSEIAKNHLKEVHPDVQKTDEQVHQDISSMMTREEHPAA